MFSGYHVEIDSIKKTEWTELLGQFNDASISQTWESMAVWYGEGNISQIVIRSDGEAISIAQVGIRKVPALKTGVANIHSGPLFRKKNRALTPLDHLSMLVTLKQEYAGKRRLLLRVGPNEFSCPGNRLSELFREAGFIHNSSASPYRTLRLDLSRTTEELRQGLERKWRQALGRAERNSSLTLESGTSEAHYHIALAIYEEMHQRKKFTRQVDMKKQGDIQKYLPESLKMKIMICRMNGEPIAALGWSSIGDTGLPLIFATSDKSLLLSTNASNLLWWQMILDLKEKGLRFLDTGGIDPRANPGGDKFKSGLVGKAGKDETRLGQYISSMNWRAKLLNTFLKIKQ
jgi:hypothetical protein